MTATLTGLPASWAGHCEPLPYTEPNSLEWLEARREGVGASDVSTILGFNPYQSAIDLWQDKRGEIPLSLDPPSPQAKWGHRLEPFIRADAEADHGVTITKPGSVVSTRWPWLRASVDGAMEDGTPFEAKSTSPWLRDQWEGDQTADHAALQVQTVMAVTGAQRALVAVVIDRGEPEYRWVDRDDRLITMIVDATERFWQHVVDGTMPPVEGTEACRNAIIGLYPEHDDTAVIDTDGQAAAAAAEYRSAAADEKAAAARKLLAGNKLRALIAGGRRVTSEDGTVLAGLKGGQIDTKTLATEAPDIAAAVTVTETVTRIDTKALKRDHPDAYARFQRTSINVPKEKN